MDQFPLKLFNLFRRVRKKGVLLITQVKVLYLNTMNKVEATQYGKFLQDILAVELKTEISTKIRKI